VGWEPLSMASAQICSRPQLRQIFVAFERCATARKRKRRGIISRASALLQKDG